MQILPETVETLISEIFFSHHSGNQVARQETLEKNSEIGEIGTCMEKFPVLYCNTQVKQVFAAGRPKGAR